MSQEQITHRTEEPQTKVEPEIHHYPMESLIGPICKAPQYLKDQYIQRGYRINFKKKRDVIKSLFMWHNEVVNIWTHLLGAIIILGLVFYVIFGYSELMRPKAIEQFNETLVSFYADAMKLEETINAQLHDGYEHLRGDVLIMQQQFNEKLQEITSYISDVAQHDLHEFQAKITNSFNWQTLQWKHNMIDVMTTYKEKAIEVIEEQEFDWIDLYLQFSKLSSNETTISRNRIISRWPILAFLLSAITCLMCSSVYHLFYCLSEKVNKVLIRLDYAGICFLVSGSTFPPLFYGFQCQPLYAILYASLQGTFAMALFSMSLCDFFHRLEWRSFKNKLFACLGFTSAIPIVHFFIWDQELQGYTFTSQLPYYFAMAVSYLSGLYIYSIRFPEKVHPGHFDNCGQSHQIWHISVVLAILFTYMGALKAYYTRLDLPCSVN